MTSESAPAALRSTRRTTIDELAAAQGVEPMVSTEEWAADYFFESDAELEAFLVDLREPPFAVFWCWLVSGNGV